MNRTMFALIVVAIIALAFLGMWLGWRARSRRDATVRTSMQQPIGAVLEEFLNIFYISTTPVGLPLTRVAVPGLRYRGRADITVREDGVTIEVRGENPVHIVASQLRGSGAGSRRVGKAVEKDGLALIRWLPEDGDTTEASSSLPTAALESSFRFDSKTEQHRFADAIDKISPTTSQAKEAAA